MMEIHIQGNENTDILPSATRKTSLALVMDACPISALALRHILEGNLFKNGSVIILDKAADVPPFLYSYSPDVVVMEISGKDESALPGIQIIADCRQQWPRIPIVVCTAFRDIRLLQQIKNTGASGICFRHDALKTIEHTVGLAMAGSGKKHRLTERVLKSTGQKFPALTRKEIQVIHHLMEGNSVSEVAQLMQRDIRTVSTHKRNAMEKLGYRDDAEMFAKGQWMAPQFHD